MKVIALTGRAGSGKDTAAKALQILTGAIDPVPGYKFIAEDLLSVEWNKQLAPHDWTVRKFAYPVYQIAAILVGRHVNDIISDYNFKNQVQAWGLTGRQLLQKIGTECFREVLGTTIWIDIMHRTLGQLKSAGTSGVIISDLRFLNEAAFLEFNWDATIIKLGGRNGNVETIHQSESEISDIVPAYLVDNSSSYIDLMDGLAEICKELNIFNCKYTWK